VVALAWGALVGGALTLLVQLPFLRGHVAGMRVSLGRDVVGVPEAIRNFGPVVAARGVVNLSSYADLILAGLLMPGAVAVMGYAQTFANLPISLFGTGVAAAELPEMARMRKEDTRLLADRVRTSTERALFFLIPSAVAYLLLGDVVVAALYETGRFGAVQSLVTWGVLAAYSLGLPASASSRVLSSAFYGLRDTRTPARVAYVRVGVSVVVGVALMFRADDFGFQSLRLGAAGLALGSTAGAWLEYVLLRRALALKVGPHGPSSSAVLRLTLAAVAAAATGVWLQTALPGAHPVITALETLVPFGAVYLTVSATLGHGLPLRRTS
jgi:putative peptidoglycan lipid II flippase